MKKNCFARMRSLFKAASGSDAPAAGTSAPENHLSDLNVYFSNR